MNRHTSGTWGYFRNSEGNYSVYSAKRDKHKNFPRIVLAEVFSEHVRDAEANARLIAASPEMYIALVAAVEALRATKIFMSSSGYDVKDLSEIVAAIDDTLNSIDAE